MKKSIHFNGLSTRLTSQQMHKVGKIADAFLNESLGRSIKLLPFCLE